MTRKIGRKQGKIEGMTKKIEGKPGKIMENKEELGKVT